MVVRNAFAQQYRDVVVGMLKACGRALDMWLAKPEEAAAIIAKQAGVSREVSMADMKADDFVPLADQASERWPGMADKPGRFPQLLKGTADFLVESSATSVRRRGWRRSSTLDALTRERMQEELHAVWRRTGMTVVFINHRVEEAVYLGTEVVVPPPPGRIVARLPSPFAWDHAGEGIRAVKSRPDFVTAREEVLSLIWQMGEG